jgi:glucosamine-6-phosphate deaminase
MTNVEVFPSKQAAGKAAAERAATIVRAAIAARGRANVVAATGASQLEFLEALALIPNVDWPKTVFFHLDEYIGLPANHPASFRRYLRERIVERLHPGNFHFIEGDAENPEAECRRVGGLLAAHSIDVAFVGIGENGHLAFNDPPADFDTEEPYLIVTLDDACRRQQLGEGWFAKFEDVPRRAISMSVRQILKAREILCVAPDARKARAVHECLDLEVSPERPASILRRHPGTTVYLDSESAALLQRRRQTRSAAADPGIAPRDS